MHSLPQPTRVKKVSTEQTSQPCRKLLAQYIERLQGVDLRWYERSSSRQYALWHGFTLAGLIASIATSVIAALMKQEFLAANAQLLLVVIPLIGAAASAMLSQFRFRELEDLRERGRIEMEDILFSAQGLLAAAPDEAACQRAFEETRKRVKELDLSQHLAHTELRVGAAREQSRTANRGTPPDKQD